MVRYIPPSPSDLLAIATSELVEADLVEAAELGRTYAESIAPVDTGHFRDSFRVESSPGEARLINDDEGAAAIEYGSDDTPAHNTLAQAADFIERGM
ncbi:MAG: HK97 gp10 family phage protein [Nocardioidaceae bacterium]